MTIATDPMLFLAYLLTGAVTDRQPKELRMTAANLRIDHQRIEHLRTRFYHLRKRREPNNRKRT